jgi:hypothetical protein
VRPRVGQKPQPLDDLVIQVDEILFAHLSDIDAHILVHPPYPILIDA